MALLTQKETIDEAIANIADRLPEEEASSIAGSLRRLTVDGIVENALDAVYGSHDPAKAYDMPNPYKAAYLLSIVPDTVMDPFRKVSLLITAIDRTVGLMTSEESDQEYLRRSRDKLKATVS